MTRNASADARIAAEVLELIENHNEAIIQDSEIHSGTDGYTGLSLQIAVVEKDD